MTFTADWIFLGLALCWMQAIRLVLQPDRNQSRYLLIGILISLAFIQWALWFQLTDPSVGALIFFLHQPCVYLPGPLLYLYAHSLLHNNDIIPLIKRHLLPAALIAIASLFETVLWDGKSPLLLNRWLYLFCFGSGAIYAGLLLSRLRQFSHPTSVLRLEFTLLSIIVSVGIGVSVIASIGGLLNNALFYQLYATTITLMMVAIYFVGDKFPELTTAVAEEILETIEIKKYEQSHLTHVDVIDVTQRLNNLMKEHCLYRQEDLDLTGLAKHLEINAHQLSQLLNDHLKTNFNSFIKAYRINEAKLLLCCETQPSITNIAYDVGFRSSSTFYKAFQDATGQAPGQYRKTHKQ